MSILNRGPIGPMAGLLVVLVGCATPIASPAPVASAVPSASAPPSPPVVPTMTYDRDPTSTTTPTETPSPRRSATVDPPPTPVRLNVGSTAVTIVDGIRVRSQPRVSDESYMEEPLLPLGTRLYVLAGPVSASGYDWYEVAPLSARTLPRGWLASASRGGEPWLAAGTFDCPRAPTDFRSLAALPAGVGPACFPRVPITVLARLISCHCDVDGAWYTPFWFHLNENPYLLVEPDVTSPPPDKGDWFGLNLDPAGEYPHVVPEGQVVEVTGIFDHPDAATCTRTEMGGAPALSRGCRLEFAVTRLVVP